MERVLAKPVHVLYLRAHGEHWVVMYDAKHKTEALRRLGEWAGNRELSFSFYDAARLSYEVRKRNGEA